MRFRAQHWADDESSVHNTCPRIASDAPATPRTFRVFRDLKAATRYLRNLKAWRKGSLRQATFADGKTIRYIVSFYGSNPRPRVHLTPKRVLMSSGIVLDRLLPTIVA